MSNMHINSLAAYHEERSKLSARSTKIYEFLIGQVYAFTDRQIMNALGFYEPNAVRPRITEMIKAGLLREVGTAKCEITNKSVRLVELAPLPDTKAEQMELL